MYKTIDTLVPDMYNLLKTDVAHALNGDNKSLFYKNMGRALYRKFDSDYAYEPRLRMSNIGKPARQVWYDINKAPRETLSAATLNKFFFGDFIEEWLILLAREAGHFVEDTQKEIEIEGIKGRMDCKIDGVVVDVKSASPFSFKKFKNNTLEKDDPFGYIDQISGYAQAEGQDEAAFLAMDKVGGHIGLLKVPTRDVRPRIKMLKAALEKDTPPERCYADVPEGQSGNRVLAMQCSYCPFKQHCWADVNDGVGLRGFNYSYGPKFFTKVVKEPRTMEFKLDAIRSSPTTN